MNVGHLIHSFFCLHVKLVGRFHKLQQTLLNFLFHVFAACNFRDPDQLETDLSFQSKQTQIKHIRFSKVTPDF